MEFFKLISKTSDRFIMNTNVDNGNNLRNKETMVNKDKQNIDRKKVY